MMADGQRNPNAPPSIISIRNTGTHLVYPQDSTACEESGRTRSRPGFRDSCNSIGLVSFVVDENYEQEEKEQEQEEHNADAHRGRASVCDGASADDNEDNDQKILEGSQLVEEVKDETENAADMEQPDLKVEDDKRDKRPDFMQQIQVQEAIRQHTSPAKKGSRFSSEYWKGVLVGLYLCQAVFVPFWAAGCVTAYETNQGFTGFLGLLLRKVAVGSVAGAGFAVVALVAMEYDRLLQKEVDALRQNSRLTESIALGSHTSPDETNTIRQDKSSVLAAETSQQPCQANMGSEQEEQNNTSRSVSVTAPSTNSEIGSDAGKGHRQDGQASVKVDEQGGTNQSKPLTQPDAPQQKVSIVNYTPDTIQENEEEKSLPFSTYMPMMDLSEPSALWTSATRTMEGSSRLPIPQRTQAAEFYPDATVLVAHICGFTAWSSQRDPEQVFYLLERLHQRFDEAAELLQVTKVDTTSNEYMAVTGVPEAQEDHAVRMVKFAKQIMSKMVTIVTAMEGTLGPGTTELRLRIGIGSGSVTAGDLGGRLEVLGQTVKTASVMESTSIRHRIQVTEETAELLRKGGKEDWIQRREDSAAGAQPGGQSTYFILMTAPLTARNKSSYGNCKSNVSLRSMRSSRTGTSNTGTTVDHCPKVPKRRQVWGDGEDNFLLSLPPMSRNARNKRLVGWVDKMLSKQLRKVVAQRCNTGSNKFEVTEDVLARVCHGAIPLQEVADISLHPKRQELVSDRSTVTGDLSEVTLDIIVSSQLRELVSSIADLYIDENPFHNFEHAANVTLSVQKLLGRCISCDEDDCENDTASRRSAGSRSATRRYMSGVANDALCQLAILFAALVHDCGHKGLSSSQLSRLNPELSAKYDHESVAEQHSIDLAWNVLMDRKFVNLHQAFFASEDDLQRFRQILVNCVLATDLTNSNAQALRSQRWETAFRYSGNSDEQYEEDSDMKATVVIECLVQASDISHSMQHWKVYAKWMERLFREKSIAFESNRSFCNPQEVWFEEELDFLDTYAIPLAKKLAASKVFGVASHECLHYALENRKIWAEKGKEKALEMHQRYCKRKEMEIGGFTNEEINNFTGKELEYIMKKLVEKGRYQGSTQAVDAKKGQNDAAQAWLDALEIYERSPASMELSDRSIVFPIYSGVYVWIKGNKIPTDPDGYFELNLARKFVRESKLHLDPIHYAQALAMLSQVYGRQGYYERALDEFAKMKEVYCVQTHSKAIAEVYGTDRAAQAFSYSALWHYRLGDCDKALAACEYVIEELLPSLDPQNTLGNFELLYNVIRVMKPMGQEKLMRDLLQEYVIDAFRKHYGPQGFTPCMSLFDPLVWLLDICVDPASFEELDASVDWLLEGDNGVIEDFLDCILTNQCWAPSDIVAELCLRLANRLALENRDLECQHYLVEKGLMLAWRSERRMRDRDGNVTIPIAYEMHEPVFNALCSVARQMGISCKDSNRRKSVTKMLDVNLPRSYLLAPDDQS